jgi:hypothetical protein
VITKVRTCFICQQQQNWQTLLQDIIYSMHDFLRDICFTCSLPPLKRQNYDPEPHQAPYEALPFSYERLRRMEADQMQLQMP